MSEPTETTPVEAPEMCYHIEGLPEKTVKQIITEKLVDEFIASTHGECNPVRYREAMIEFLDKALQAAFNAGQEFCNDNR